MLNGHGDDLHLIEGVIEYNFSSNVYYKGCPKPLLDEIAIHTHKIQSYPSPIASELNTLAAEKFQLHKKQFLFTNGATEAFYLIAQLFSGKKAAIVAPTFSEYKDACRIFNLNYQLISRKEIKDQNADILFLCNPNNPDGTVFSKNQIEQFLIDQPTTLFVIDEAYIEFTNSTTSVVSLTKKYLNLIVVRSLTKTFTIPGLRLGYIVSNVSYIDALLHLKMPWSVNLLAIKAGEYIFNNYSDLQFEVSKLLEETQTFKNNLKQIKGIRVCESTTSYFLVELLTGSAKDLKAYLIKNHRILIRDATNFNPLKGQYIRLSVQDKKANRLFIEALKKWI